MFNLKNQKILVIAPHPDDEIFGAGGLIAKAKRLGSKVYVLYMTVGLSKDFSKSGSSTQGERIEEIKNVADFLKLDGWDIGRYPFFKTPILRVRSTFGVLQRRLLGAFLV